MQINNNEGKQFPIIGGGSLSHKESAVRSVIMDFDLSTAFPA